MTRCKVCGVVVMRSYGGQCMRCLAYERHGTAKTLWFVLAVGLVIAAVLVWLTGPSWAQLGEPCTQEKPCTSPAVPPNLGDAGRIEIGPSEPILYFDEKTGALSYDGRPLACLDKMEQAMRAMEAYILGVKGLRTPEVSYKQIEPLWVAGRACWKTP